MKPNIYTTLSDTLRSIGKLYETINNSTPNWKIKLPGSIPMVLENFLISPVTIDNLVQIRELLNDANKIIEDKLLDIKSQEITNTRLKSEIETLKEQLSILNEKTEEFKSNSEALAEEKKQSENSLKEQTGQLKKVIEKQFLSFSQEIILMRDNLCMKEEILKEEENYKETKTWKLLQASYRETEGILNRMGISVIRHDGPFDENIQMVTDVVRTDKEELNDTVAQTFREGYRTNDKLIRLQEVILYSYKKPEVL